jgi:hypothetical protein
MYLKLQKESGTTKPVIVYRNLNTKIIMPLLLVANGLAGNIIKFKKALKFQNLSAPASGLEPETL